MQKKNWTLNNEMSIIDEELEETVSFRSGDDLKTKMGKLGIYDKEFFKKNANKTFSYSIT